MCIINIMETTTNVFKILLALTIVASFVFGVLKLKEIEETKKKQLEEYQNVVKLLENYKPVTITNTLVTDDQFMSILVKKLSSDSEFLAAVAKAVKNPK